MISDNATNSLNGHTGTDSRTGSTSRDSTRAWQWEQFEPLIDSVTGEIGRVVSSEKEPAGSHLFYFWAADDALTLDVGHIVVAFSEEAAVIGVVDEPRRYSDLKTFLDDYFDRHVELALAHETPTQRPEILVFTVKVLATQHRRKDVQSQRPVINGPVYFATQHAIEYALGRDSFTGNAIPALMHTNGNYLRDSEGTILVDEDGRPRFQKTPLFLDEDYLLGPEAGHANWTGQSGLATKTSHALFLISSVFQTLEMKDDPTTVAALMFNVKGPDLLWLDKPAEPGEALCDAYQIAGWSGLSEDERLAYSAFGLEPRPFTNTRVFAPFRPGAEPPINAIDTVDLSNFSGHSRLNTDRNATGETDNVFPILWSLDRALKYPYQVFSFADLDDKLSAFLYELSSEGVDSLAKLNRTFARIWDELAESGADTWKSHHKATIRKAENRFNGLKPKLGGLLGDGTVEFGNTPLYDGKFVSNEVRVIDISQCNSVAQELIVSSTIDRIWRMAEKHDMGVTKLIVFVDELNKYAPAGGEGSLRNTLVDIAARGRHLNVVLLGAQQFRSKVDGEILGNCGTSFYGRIGDEEIINSAYRSISETAKQELLGLPKGRMLVRHAHFRAPLFGTFPRPATIPGAVGQKIFNGDTRAVDPAAALHLTLKQLMGEDAPSLASVRTEAAGVSPEDLDNTRIQVWNRYGGRKKQGMGWNPWKMAQGELRSAAARGSRS